MSTFSTLKKLVPFLSGDLRDEAQLAWRLLRDPRVPIYLKALPVLAIAYAIFPEPWGIIPVIGQLDDLLVLTVASAAFVRLAPQDSVEEHRVALGMTPKNQKETTL